MNYRRSPNAGVILRHCLRRSPSITRTLGQRLVFAGMTNSKLPKNRRRCLNVVWMLGQRRRRCPNILAALDEGPVHVFGEGQWMSVSV